MKEVKKIKTILKFSFLIVALALFGNVVYRAVVKAATGAPAIVSYQGRLTDSSGALLGGSGTNYFFKFSIWDNSTVGSGSKLWPSGSPGIATSTVTEGVFNVNIGDISNNFPDALDYNFNDNDTVFLQVEVSSNGSSFETLSPRQQIASTGFAINANTLKGFLPSQSASGNQIPVLNSGNLILGGTNPQLNATGTNALVLQGGGGTGDIRFFSSANNINTDGELTIAGTLTIGSYVADPSGLSNGTIFYNSTSNKFKIVENGTTKILCNTTDAGCGAGGGSPTWSSIIDPTGNLALIMASTTSTFTWGSDTGSNNLFNFNDTTGNTGTGTLVSVTTASGSTVNPFRVSAAGINSIYVNSSGNVGFGTTTPTAKVSIVGLAGNNNVFSLASSTGSTLLTVSPAGTVTINNNLSVSGQTNLGNASTTALTVSGVSVLATTSATALTVNTINGNILTSGSGTVTLNSNTLTLSGSATLNQDLRTSDSPTFAGLTINGSQTISGTLGVTGTSTLATTTLVGRLSVSGSTTLSSLGTGLVRSSSGGLYTDIATYLQAADLANYSTYAYGSSTYVNFGYATNTFATLLNTPSYTYGSSTYVNFGYASNTFATLLNTPSYTYASSTFPSFSYASSTFATAANLLSYPTFTYGSSTYVNYGYATNTFATLLNTPSYTYGSSTFPSFGYATNTFATIANYPTYTYATNTFATLLNTPSYTYASSTFPSFGYASSTYATAANLLSYPTFTYGSSTYVNFGYATNTFATLLNTPSYTYGSSTYVNYGYATNTFATLLNTPSYTYTSSTFPSFTYASTTFATAANLLSYPTFTYGSSTYVNFGYATNTFATLLNTPSYTYGSSTYATAANLLNYPTFTYGSSTYVNYGYATNTFATLLNTPSYTYGSSTYVNFGYATNTFATLLNTPSYTYASSTFPSFSYASSTFQPAGSYLTSALTSLSNLSGPAIHVATTSDTNIQISISTTTANTLTFIPSFTGTLAASRLNSNVVQGVTNDTNVTGSITAQNLTLGWTGQLSVARGGTGVGTLTPNAILLGNGISNIATVATSTILRILQSNGGGAPTFVDIASLLTAGSNIVVSGTSTIAVSDTPSFTSLSTTGNLSVGGSLSVTATTTLSSATTTINGITYYWPNSQAVGVKVLQNDGNGNLSWVADQAGGGGTLSGGTIGFVMVWASSTGATVGTLRDNGTVAGINATSSTVTFNIQGTAGDINPFVVASSTGVALFTIAPSGSTTIANLGTGLVRSSSGSLYTDNTTYLTSASADLLYPSFTYASSTFPSFTYASTTYATAANLLSYPTFTYGSSTYVNFGYASNTFATLLNTPSYTYASSTFPSFTYASTTFATAANLLSYPTFTYGSSTYVNFGYASNTFATLLNTPSYTYGSSTYVNFGYATNTFATIANYPTYTYATNTFATLLNTPSYTYGSSTYVNYGYATNTFATLLNTPSYTYASSTFPSFGYATNTFATLLNTPSYTYASSSYATAWNLRAGSNITITTSTPGQITLAATDTGLTTIGSGNPGFVSIWNGANTLSQGLIRDNGTVAGINATSSTVTFNIQGTSGSTNNIFNVSSSTGISILTATSNQRVGVGTSSPIATLTVQGTSTYPNINPFVVASSNGTSLLTVAPSGYVGINATSPTYNLEIFESGTEPVTSLNIVNTQPAGVSTLYVAGSSLGPDFGAISYLKSSFPATNLIAGPNLVVVHSGTSTTGGLNIVSTNDSAPIRFGTGGSAYANERMRITAAGYVGIGTITPTATLFVQGTTTAPTVNPFVVASSTGSQLLTVLPSGNVGVGATSPETNLHVVNTSAGLESMPLLLQNSSSNSGTAVKVRLAATTSQGANANGLIDFVGTRQSDGSMDLNFLLSPGGSGAPTSRVYLDGSTGALGIGTATPTSLLQVAGDLTVGSVGTANGRIVFRNNSNANTVTLLSTTTLASNLILTLPTTTPTLGQVLSSTANGELYWSTASAGSLSGSGAVGKLAVWNGNSSLTNSILFDNGTVAGVNATSSTVLFNLQGTSGSTNNIFNISSSTGISILAVTENQRVGIGSSSPIATLTVQGTSTYPNINPFVVASSNGTSLLTVAPSGNLGIKTANPLSTLHVKGGTIIENGGIDSLNTQLIFAPTDVPSAYLHYIQTSHSSTVTNNNSINLFVSDTAGVGRNVMTLLGNGNVGIGSSTPVAKLVVIGTTTASGANAVAGIFASTTLESTTASGFQFGNRFISTITGSASGTLDGMLIRTVDNTSNNNTVRALEVQGYSGSNTSGVNTGIQTYGKTFGLYAVTTALAGSVSQPAAIFAELDNSGAPTTGNAIRAYTNDATSADLVSFYQETSAFTGTGLLMNFGNGTGSYTGKFLQFQNAGTNKFIVDSFGQTAVGTSSIGSMFDIASSTSTSNIDLLRVVSNVGSTGNVKFRVDSDGDVFSDGGTAMGTPADVAENYPVLESGIVAGDVVVLSTTTVDLINSEVDTTSTLGGLVKATSSNSNILGVVSTRPGVLLSAYTQNSVPVALSGRVPVKVSGENGNILPGDYLTMSKIYSGFAAKANYSTQVIGMALQAFEAATSTATSTIEVFVKVGWQNVNNRFVLGESDGQLTGQVGSGAPTSTSLSYLIDQKGIGDILQLQSKGENRVVFGQMGDMNILASTTIATSTLLSVTNSTSTVFTINARGDIQTQGVIIVKDNTFAGSMATNQEGVAEINFTYHLGTGKPVVQLTPEGEVPVFAQVLTWKKDSQENYIGFTMKTFSLNGTPASAVVHYSVIGKQEGYETLGEALQVQSQPSSGGGASDQGQVAGQQEQGEEGSTLEEGPLPNEENVVEGQEPPVIENPVPVTEPENTPVTPSGAGETSSSENSPPPSPSGAE